jgi:hypothetical protein
VAVSTHDATLISDDARHHVRGRNFRASRPCRHVAAGHQPTEHRSCLSLRTVEAGDHVLAPGNLVIGPGKSVVAGSGTKLLIGRREEVEEVKLTLAGEDLVVPLDMLQDGGAGARGGDDVARGETVGQPIRLYEAELSDDRAPQPGSQGSAHRKPVPGSHRHAKESDVLPVDPAGAVYRG